MDRTGTGLRSSGDGLVQAHLVGMDERGMMGLAQVLTQGGVVVTGLAPNIGQATDRLGRLGVRVHAGHSPSSAPKSARLLVYGPGVSRVHPDRLAASRSGIAQESCPEVLAGLLRGGVGIAASGGRKAGLIAAMVGWTLTHAGLDPTVVLGSAAPQLGGSGRLGRGPHVVVDDQGGSPGPAWPGVAIAILHDDSSGASRAEGLRRWAEASPPEGYVLAFADEVDPSEADLPAVVERFSLAPGHAWWGADLRHDRGCYRFRAFHRGQFVVEIRLQVPGRQAAIGALAAVAACGRVDLTTRAIKEALEEFGGISRGFESRGSYRGVTLVDDEADSPTGVAEALAVAREAFGRRRLCVAYGHPEGSGRPWPPAESFAEADRAWIIGDRADAGSGESGASGLVGALEAMGARVDRASNLDEAIRELDRNLEPGDVLVTLGAGEVGTIADAFLRRLRRDRHA